MSQLMKTYRVWITLFSSSANNVGIIGTAQHTRSSWASGKLEYLPINDGSQEYYEFLAIDDARAYTILTQMFNQKHPNNKKPISGKSYLYQCRESLRKTKG